MQDAIKRCTDSFIKAIDLAVSMHMGGGFVHPCAKMAPEFQFKDKATGDKIVGNNGAVVGIYPSDAYRKNCASYTYRISELVFGSLLAAYILGFINTGVGMVHSVVFPTSWSLLAAYFDLLDYVCISVSFALLTASTYITYHNSILTMPSIRVGNLRIDFILAISQAVLFGFSNLFPHTFLMWLSLSLIILIKRQRTLQTQLALSINHRFSSAATNTNGEEMFILSRKARTRRNKVRETFNEAINAFNRWLINAN
ncbi:MAG: hypothetical protein JST76_08865, partial [Bacteroidetes bacterium]|nr:hypothetical protein [Bacteroidota bacterium]